MRRRSGALHCDSQQDFMQLAQAAHNHMGIFYDEKMNKKIMHQFKNTTSPSTPTQTTEISNPELSAEKQPQDYRGFQFGLESDGEKEEREELERYDFGGVPSQNIAVICRDVHKMVCGLEGREGNAASEQRWLDLVVAQFGGKRQKMWIFSKESIDSGDSLIELYLQNCKIVLDCCGSAKIIRNASSQPDESIFSRLCLPLHN